MSKTVKKRPLTLIEVMIVIFIIGTIGSVLGLRMRKSMDKGKAFKTELAINKLYEVIIFEEIRNPSQIERSLLKSQIRNSEFVKDPESVLKDGWGEDFQFLQADDDKVEFYSRSYVDYCQKNKKKESYPWDEEDDPVRPYPWLDEASSVR